MSPPIAYVRLRSNSPTRTGGRKQRIGVTPGPDLLAGVMERTGEGKEFHRLTPPSNAAGPSSERSKKENGPKRGREGPTESAPRRRGTAPAPP